MLKNIHACMQQGLAVRQVKMNLMPLSVNIKVFVIEFPISSSSFTCLVVFATKFIDLTSCGRNILDTPE